MNVIICGGGVIGSALAYALSCRAVDVKLIERWRIGGAASGKSGGFLAKDWCDNTPAAALARTSFDLHTDWAERLGNPYGYRRVETFSATLDMRRRHSSQSMPNGAKWLAEDVLDRRPLGTSATTAQLDPTVFTRTLADAAAGLGAQLITGIVSGVEVTADASRIRGVRLADGTTHQSDVVIIAMGPWSLLATAWLPLPAIHGLKGHSVIFRPRVALPAEAIFAEVEDMDGEVLTPEIVPRADGTLYVCGLSGFDDLPVEPSRVQPEAGGCERLRDIARRLVPQLHDAEVVAQNACFRPVAPDGMPIIGPIAGPEGAYVASGHSVWGMLNATGTAEALAELIATGAPSTVDLGPFSPKRLPVCDQSHWRVRPQ
ncbi:MAG: NAD(P)/FAD-dependent oxidoreductase [Hyphomicrobiaceae bacterium]